MINPTAETTASPFPASGREWVEDAVRRVDALISTLDATIAPGCREVMLWAALLCRPTP